MKRVILEGWKEVKEYGEDLMAGSWNISGSDIEKKRLGKRGVLPGKVVRIVLEVLK